ncbi:MAPEG family protein [Myxococcota bacterium]|nr:MAPEG family protein [Myxococcota bacterium]
MSIVAGIALIQYTAFILRAGRLRGQHGIPAPATTGHPEFERHLRVQSNTVEQLVVFLPALFLFAYWVSEPWAAGLGGVFVLGRALYARSYVAEPSKRGPGFLLTLVPNLVLTLGAVIGAALALWAGR